MRSFKILFLLVLLSIPTFAAKVKNGEDLIIQMHKKYAGNWYQTLTFVQKTIRFRPDGTTDIQTWYEAMKIPGKLRIDIAPLDKGNGILFADGSQHSFRDGKLAGSRPAIHPLLVLGFDVYGQPAEKTISQLKELGIDLSVLHQAIWQGRTVYVVGAKQGDLSSPQFWIDKKNLYFVRLIQPTGKDKTNLQETQFNKYQKVKGGGWIAPEVIFIVDGKQTLLEEYSDIQTNTSLDNNLFEPNSWMTVERTYFQKK
jgi:outer membrane lipoprotein-sorting protein